MISIQWAFARNWDHLVKLEENTVLCTSKTDWYPATCIYHQHEYNFISRNDLLLIKQRLKPWENRICGHIGLSTHITKNKQGSLETSLAMWFYCVEKLPCIDHKRFFLVWINGRAFWQSKNRPWLCVLVSDWLRLSVIRCDWLITLQGLALC